MHALILSFVETKFCFLQLGLLVSGIITRTDTTFPFCVYFNNFLQAYKTHKNQIVIYSFSISISYFSFLSVVLLPHVETYDN